MTAFTIQDVSRRSGLITGPTGGLGKTLALELANRGAS
jgi:hypothetical protein